ncbi:hypothetical protein [Kitasatospora sp. GP82]|uniref:hypothetical protein n=1 Tax=Kitasatospora sp. GP82 TaxID=3035089 RepID=UPI0024762091|nr:hypothetical protein [Kitasatospora sp. GP82]MDH6125953.1 hypothetical protein [Kitasatospora sp. GP82]
MDVYDEDDLDDEFEDAEEWQEGECDHCFGGEPTPSPFGPIYCACEIGQGAQPENCVCGPED